MRIYLEKAQTVTGERGKITSYGIGPASDGEFYEVSDELGQKWINEGVAKYASLKNEILDEAPAKPAPTRRRSRHEQDTKPIEVPEAAEE